MVIKFSDLKLRTKFLFSFIVIILFTVFIISTVNFVISENTLKNETGRFSEYLINQIGINLESRIKEIEETVFLQFSNSPINMDLKKSNTESTEIDLYSKRINIENFMFKLASNKWYISLVSITDRYGNRYDYKKKGVDINPDRILGEPEQQKLKSLWGKAEWAPGEKGLIYMKRALFDVNTLEYLGTIVVSVDNNYLKNLYNNMDEIEGGKIILLDHSNNIMIWDDELSKEIGNFAIKNDFFRQQPNGMFVYGNTKYISTVQSSPNGMWKIMQVISIEELTKNSNIIKTWIFITCLISILVAFLLALLISGGVTRRISMLVKNIKIASTGDFNVKIKPESKDEIGMLVEEFNQLFDKIIYLINTVQNEKLLAKNAEYKALQFEYSALLSQINPHFLYNTLETINCMAKLKGEKEISEALYILGCLLRETLRKKNDTIELCEELDYIKNYLNLQKLSYGERMNILYDLDNGLLSVKVPKFILQPVVENAIVHGIEKKFGKGLIIIRCFRSGNDLVIEVEDDGAGFDIDKYNLLDTMDAEEDEKLDKHTKIGIKSVDKRIKILYGDSYGVNISSEIGKGTVVKILIPII